MKTVCYILILLICTLELSCCCVYSDETKTDIWEKAESKFIHRINPQLERLRKQLNNPHLGVMQIRDPLLAKYLPAFRLYVIDSNLSSSSRIYCVHRDGRVFNLGHGSWTSSNSKGITYSLPRITDFLRSQKIRVKNSGNAIELAKMIESMVHAPDFVGQLRREMKNFTVLDRKRLRDMFSETSIWTFTAEKNWKYVADKSKKGWFVKIEYVGPPMSIAARPKYYLEVRDDSILVDISARF